MVLNQHLSYCILPWSCLLPVSFTGCQSCRTRTVGCCVHCCVPGAWNSTWHSLCLNKCLLNKLNEWVTVGMLSKFSVSQKHKWVKQQLPTGLRVGETIVVGEGAALNFWEWLPYVWGGSRSTAPANSCHRRAGSLLPDFKAFLLRKARKWLKNSELTWVLSVDNQVSFLQNPCNCVIQTSESQVREASTRMGLLD